MYSCRLIAPATLPAPARCWIQKPRLDLPSSTHHTHSSYAGPARAAQPTSSMHSLEPFLQTPMPLLQTPAARLLRRAQEASSMLRGAQFRHRHISLPRRTLRRASTHTTAHAYCQRSDITSPADGSTPQPTRRNSRSTPQIRAAAGPQPPPRSPPEDMTVITLSLPPLLRALFGLPTPRQARKKQKARRHSTAVHTCSPAGAPLWHISRSSSQCA